jgi:diadenosine tetraphosphate (Ap4A) HIT family hydrolase
MPYRYPPPGDCPFCAADPQEDRNGPVILQTDHVVALVPARMRTWGSVAIVPRRHVPTSFELTEAESRDAAVVLRRVLRAVESALDPDGLNVWWATGLLADQPLEHLLIEVAPRWERVPYRYTDWHDVPAADPAKRAELASLLREGLK